MPGLLLLTLLINALPATPAAAVRIGLFRLFTTKVVRVRAAGGHAVIRYGGPAGSAAEDLYDGESLLLTSRDNAVDGVVPDLEGRRLAFLRSSAISIVPKSGAVLEIAIPGKISRRVRGQLVASAEASPVDGGSKIRLVLTTDLESAVRSIVAAELRGAGEDEARKALEVLSRSYLLAHPGRHSSDGFDFCDTTHCQLYQGDAGQEQRPATRGKVLRFQGRVIDGYYTAACGGRTLTPADAWGGKKASGYRFRRVACSWCRQSEHWRWRRSADAAQVFEALSNALGKRISGQARLVVETEAGSAIVRSVDVRDAGRRLTLSADALRRAIGKSLGWNTVLSPSFTVQRRGRFLIFEGRGFGSQVGLCVAGARAQAAAGRSYVEILSFYYPGTSIGESRIGVDR